MFDILMVFLKEFFEKVDVEKNQHMTKQHEKLPSRQRVKYDPPSIMLSQTNLQYIGHEQSILNRVPTEIKKIQFHGFSTSFHDQQCNFHDY